MMGDPSAARLQVSPRLSLTVAADFKRQLSASVSNYIAPGTLYEILNIFTPWYFLQLSIQISCRRRKAFSKLF